jgi:alpha-1,6-mannosyltransferase
VTLSQQPARRPSSALFRLLAIGSLSGVLYFITNSTQRLIAQDRGLDGIAGASRQPVLYVGATLGLFGLYSWFLMICRRGELRRPDVRAVAVVMPIVFNGLFLLAMPSLTIDTLSYISHGYITAELGDNPYVVPSRAVAATPLGPELMSFGWRPVHPVSPYGPVWTHIEAAVVRVADDVSTEVVLMKLIAVVFSLGSAVLIWILLGRTSPEHRLLGTLAYLWNPLIIVELAGEGHNDSMMVFFTLLALVLTIIGRGGGGVTAMSLGALSKYLPLLLMPLQVAYLWRMRANVRQLTRQLASGAILSVLLATLAFATVWAGAQTFDGVRATGQSGHTGSTQTVLAELLSRISPASAAETIVSVVAVAAFVIFLGIQARSVIDARRLFRACAWVAVVYLLIASPSYWPWYAVLPVALLALVPQKSFLLLLVSLSLGARLVAPLDQMFVHGALSRPTYLIATWLGATVMPLLMVAAFQFGKRQWRQVVSA